MRVQYKGGVRLDGLCFDPRGRVEAALLTHRPGRRGSSQRLACSAPLAGAWPKALALPMGRSVVALGRQIELVPTGYGIGGAAALVNHGGQRAFVVGPTTTCIEPRPADVLVLYVPEIATLDCSWLRAVGCPDGPKLLVLPDGAALEAAAATLRRAGLPFKAPKWAEPVGGSDAVVRLAMRGDGLRIDMRPQADECFLALFAERVQAREIWLHGPRARILAARLVDRGVPTRVLGPIPVPAALRNKPLRAWRKETPAVDRTDLDV